MTTNTATTEFGKCCEEVACKTADEFIGCLRLTHPRWVGTGLDAEWLFRGQADAGWELVPSAWRTPQSAHADGWTSRLRSLVTNNPQFENILFSWSDADTPPFGLERPLLDKWRELGEDTKQERVRAFVAQTAFEVQLIYDFWMIADGVAHLVEAPDWLGLRLSQIVPLTVGGQRERFFKQTLVATAQHHGVPTRLLDWTLHPLTAAFFATDDVDTSTAKQVAVWAVRRDAVKRSRLREFRVPRHTLPFLHAQAGCFVWDPLAAVQFASTGRWPSQLETLQAFHAGHTGPPPARPWIYRFVLPAEEAKRVAEMLWKERLSRSHLMPTPDNVTRTLGATVNWRGPGSLLD